MVDWVAHNASYEPSARWAGRRPAEVESILSDLPALREVAVSGWPHETWSESGCMVAAAALPEEHSLSLEEVHSFEENRLASFKRPTRLEIAEALPRGHRQGAEARASPSSVRLSEEPG